MLLLIWLLTQKFLWNSGCGTLQVFGNSRSVRLEILLYISFSHCFLTAAGESPFVFFTRNITKRYRTSLIRKQ